MCEFISGFISVKHNKISIGDPTFHSDNIVHSALDDWREFELTKNGYIDIRTYKNDNKNMYLATAIELIGPKLTKASLAKKYSPSINRDGDKYYWNTKGFHRINSPAVEYADGTKEWFLNGQRHRTNGPAVEYSDGTKFWYLNGKKLTKQEFLKRIR